MNLKLLIKEGIKNKIFMAGLIIFLSILLIAVFAGVIAPYPYDEIHAKSALLSPGSKYLFGTDQYGRDIFSRVVYGSKIALRVGLIVVVIETIIGVILGLISGFYGGFWDKVIMFVTDLTWAMPPVILALAIVTMLGPSLNNVIISIAVVSWAQFTKIVRAKTQSIKSAPFIEAAKAMGENDVNIISRYILPNVLSPIIVLSTLALPTAILSTTSLGFLGLGAQPPSPDWGVMLKDGIGYIKQAPWICIFPGIAIAYTVLGFNLLGEGIRDLLDPRLKI